MGKPNKHKCSKIVFVGGNLFSCCDACWKNTILYIACFQKGARVGKTTRTFDKLCLCSSFLPLSFPGRGQGRTTPNSGKCKKPHLFVQRKTHIPHVTSNKHLAPKQKQVLEIWENIRKQVNIHVAASSIC